MKQSTIKQWLDLVANQKAHCYIKPTRRVHDSKFRVFEVGYCTLGDKNKIADKIILGEHSDHVWLLPLYPAEDLSMDLTIDGYIRIWSNHEPLVWGYGGNFVVSTARLQPLSTVRGMVDNLPK